MSFFKPDNNTPAADPTAQGTPVVADPITQSPADDSSQSVVADPAPDTTLQDGVDDTNVAPTPSNDVTVTTDEGSTLHTFNDPTLQSTPAPAPDSDTDTATEFSTPDLSAATQDAGSASDGVNDALSFQSTDDNPFVTPAPVADAGSDTDTDAGAATSEENSEQDGSGLPDTMLAGDSATTEVATPNFAPTSLGSDNSELDDIKKQALEQLRPLLEKVDLPAGEKFDKYLMMLRATDDPTLIQPAFNAAQGITEEKDKAEALVDIINEINYVSGETQTAQD